MDRELGDYNNGDLGIEWHEVLDISSVRIQHQFINEGKASADIFHEEDFDPSIDKEYYDIHSIKRNTQVSYESFDPSVETVYLEDEIMGLGDTKKLRNFDKLCFYDDPRAQMDNGAKCSVTNIVDILRDVKWYNKKFKPPVHMKGATSGNIIVPAAEGLLRVQANTKLGHLDVLYFYSPHFTSTLLSDRDILRSCPYCKQFSGQMMNKYFELDNKKVDQALATDGCVDLQSQNEYHLDYGHCTLTCIHDSLKRKNVEIPGIVRGGLCFTLPLILPDLPPDHPDANKSNSSKIAYETDKEFQESCDSLKLQTLYEYQQQKHIELMEVLTQVPPEFHTLPFHLWDTDEAMVDSITDSARELLWHQKLIHVGQHSMKSLHLHVDGIPNLSNANFNDLTKCATCLKANLTKSPAGHSSLRESLTRAYQGLYIDFGFPGRIAKDKDGNVIESSQTDIEGLNGEQAWILISDGKTRMLHGDTRLSKASAAKYLESFLLRMSFNCIRMKLLYFIMV